MGQSGAGSYGEDPSKKIIAVTSFNNVEISGVQNLNLTSVYSIVCSSPKV